MAPRLFDGVRFWVDSSVPMRARWLDGITEHGGVLTREMNTADVRIADHVKKAGKTAPEHAVSWTYIEQSVKNGILEDIESHRVDRHDAGPMRIAKPTKGRRAKFTRQDDQALANWLAIKEQEGEALNGNKIYQTLESICPQHTWQSWRTRAVNYKGLLPKPRGLDAFRERVAQVNTVNKPDAPGSVPRTIPARALPTSSARSRTSTGAGTGRVKFTAEDDKLLLQYVKEAGKDPNGNKLYKSLEEEHPHHTWHSWRDRYVRHLQPRLKAEAAEAEAGEEEGEERAKEQGHARTGKEENTETETRTAGNYPAPTGQQGETSGMTRVLPQLRPDMDKTVVTSTNFATGLTRPSYRSDRPSRDSTAGLASDNGSNRDCLVVEIESRPRLNASAAPDEITTAPPKSKAESSYGSSAGPGDSEKRKPRGFESRFLKIKSAKLIQRNWRGYRVRTIMKHLQSELTEKTHNLPTLQAHCRGVLLRVKVRDFDKEDLVGFQARANGALVRMALRADRDDNEANELTADMTPRPQRVKTEKEEFYTDWWNEYLAATGTDPQSIQWPRVQGRTLDLWELWHTVQSLDQEGRSQSARNWENIAERLGFDWVESPEVTIELRKCYETTLGEFEVFQAAFKAFDPGSQAETETKASVAESDVGGEIPELELPNNSLGLRSSPPALSGSKRSFENGPGPSSVDLSFISVKRARYSKDVEIPTTPETTSEQQRRQAAVSSDETPRRPESLPHRAARLQPPPQTNIVLEPETQDFVFDGGIQSQPDIDSATESTPLQQLHIESTRISPIPFSGIKQPKLPYRSPLGTQSTSLPKVIPDSAVARPVDRRILSSVEDLFVDDAMPEPTQTRQAPVRTRSPVPVAKRRSLPVSFQRAVTPPKASAKKPLAPPRVSLPAKAASKPGVDAFAPPSRPFLERSSLHSAGTARHTNIPSSSALRHRPPSSRPSNSPMPSSEPRVFGPGPTPPAGSSTAESIAFYVARGYKKQHVINAFKATMTWGLAAVVMEEFKAGRGLPENWSGVWTSADDADLKFVMEVEAEMEGRRRTGSRPDGEAKERVRRAERCRTRLELKHTQLMIRDRIRVLGG